MTDILIRNAEDAETHIKEGDVKMEAETGVMSLQAEESQGLQAATGS